MSSVSQIRTALKDTITAANSAVFGYQQIPESVNVPAAIIVPRSSDFVIAMGRGADAHEFDVIVLVGRADDSLAQTAVDAYVTGAGASSIRQAIFNARGLGLSDCDAHVYGMESYGAEWDIGGINYVGAVLKVRVHTSGTA